MGGILMLIVKYETQNMIFDIKINMENLIHFIFIYFIIES